MRHSMVGGHVRALLVASGIGLGAVLSGHGTALAQPAKPKPAAAKPAPKPAKPQKPVKKDTSKSPTPGVAKPGTSADVLELDDAAPAKPSSPAAAKPAPLGPPPVPGTMTDDAAQAKKLFDEENWGDASLALYRVVQGQTSDDEGNKQLAQFHLAIALYKLKFYQASYGIFSQIAGRPNHLKYDDTLFWLAKLATDLPEPADIVEQVGNYSEAAIDKTNSGDQRETYAHLCYLLGRYKYRNRQFEDALRLFSKIDRQSAFYIKGQFFAGITNVQLRKSSPAVQSFQRVTGAVAEGLVSGAEAARLRDLAHLSTARTFYSASVRADNGSAPTIDEAKLSAAVKYWNRVDVASEYWLDALFEESWAYFMAGDYAHALGNIHTIQSPYFPNGYYPEADVLKSVIYFTNCQYEDAEVLASKFQAKYQPMYDDLTKVLDRYKGDGNEELFFKLLKEVRDDRVDLSPQTRIVIRSALSDRQLLRHLSYVEALDEEDGRFKKAPQSFRDSPLGNDVKDALQLARDIALRNAGQLARERYQRNLDELNEHLRNNAKILIDINAARRNQLDAAIAGSQVSVQESQRNVVRPDEEHVIWPFDGEYWRDELGFFRQTITSKCGR